MRIRFVLWVLLLAPLSAGAGSLSLEAHEIGTKDGFESYWETSWGSYDRDYVRGKRILVTIRDFSRKIPRCDITVYFIAHALSDPSVRFIYDRQEFSPEFHGRIDLTGPVEAEDVHARILNLAALGERFGKGADMDGWIVVGKLKNQTFGIRASSQTLLEVAQENPRQVQTLTEMMAEYEKALAR